MENDKITIQDSFRYLVANGNCVATYHEDPYFTTEPYWIVALNGRLYTQTEPGNSRNWVFQCKTEHGTVDVVFKRK